MLVLTERLAATNVKSCGSGKRASRLSWSSDRVLKRCNSGWSGNKTCLHMQFAMMRSCLSPK
jgi:hypothetical protein